MITLTINGETAEEVAEQIRNLSTRLDKATDRPLREPRMSLTNQIQELAHTGEIFAPSAIVGVNRESIYPAIGRACKQGIIRRVGPGQYQGVQDDEATN